MKYRRCMRTRRTDGVLRSRHRMGVYSSFGLVRATNFDPPLTKSALMRFFLSWEVPRTCAFVHFSTLHGPFLRTDYAAIAFCSDNLKGVLRKCCRLCQNAESSRTARIGKRRESFRISGNQICFLRIVVVKTSNRTRKLGLLDQHTGGIVPA